MSIFETHVKDVAERTDSDPLSLNVGFQVVDSADQLDGEAVEAKPGHVVAVDTSGTGSAVTVNMPETNLKNTKVTVKVLDATNTVTVTDLNGSDITIDSQYSAVTILSDGDAYHAVSAYDATSDSFDAPA